MMSLARPSLSALLVLADLCLQLGRVDRATLHPDGVRPESDTDHTVMLAVIACALAERHPELGLDLGLVAQLAVVHDLVEAHAGDVDTFGGDAASRAAKEARERRAQERIATDCAAWPWLNTAIETYERQALPEARFVRLLDKLCPRLTNVLNGGAAIRARGMDQTASVAHDRALIAGLAVQYPEFEGVVGPLLREAADASARAWRQP